MIIVSFFIVFILVFIIFAHFETNKWVLVHGIIFNFENAVPRHEKKSSEMKKWWPDCPDYEKILQAYVTFIGWEQKIELNQFRPDLQNGYKNYFKSIPSD